MEKIKLSLDIVNSSKFHNLGIELWMDREKFFDNLVSPGTHHVIYEFAEDEADHKFKIVLKNKTDDHTIVDDQGNIIQDALIKIDNICLDEIMIDQLIYEKAEYIHDGNGSKTIAIHKFYGNLGCNGHVQLKFSTPVYIWLLENM